VAAPIPRLMVVDTVPPPRIRPERIPRGPRIGLPAVDWGPPPPLPEVTRWACDKCGATGTGCADDGFAHEEADHCLTGCNGSLRAVGGPDAAPGALLPIPAKMTLG
jgi:hypothetical protein